MGTTIAALVIALAAGQAEPAPGRPEGGANAVGVEATVPAAPRGRLLELPARLFFEQDLPLGEHLEAGWRFGLGYGNASRLAGCAGRDCGLLLASDLGGLVRLRTARSGAASAWLALGGGVSAAQNWDASLVGGVLRIDGGVDLRLGGRRVRLVLSWIEGAFGAEASGLSADHQRYAGAGLTFLQGG